MDVDSDQEIPDEMQNDAELNDNSNSRMNPEQVDAIITYMGDPEHSEFAAGRFTGADGKASRERQGQRLAEIVSALGPPNRSWKQIQGKWSRMKMKAKAYNAKKIASRRTGNKNGPPADDVTSERILKIFGKSHGNGLNIIPEVGGSMGPHSQGTSCSVKTSPGCRTFSISSNPLCSQLAPQMPSTSKQSYEQTVSRSPRCSQPKPLPTNSTQEIAKGQCTTSPSYTKFNPENTKKTTLLRKAKEAIAENTEEMKKIIDLKEKENEMRSNHYKIIEKLKKEELELLKKKRLAKESEIIRINESEEEDEDEN